MRKQARNARSYQQQTSGTDSAFMHLRVHLDV
ncbi:hypothetical protein FHT09_001746 [Xanthomonas arboricola]|nr:hypothetical protein [Xanthomonas sp. CFBP 8152]